MNSTTNPFHFRANIDRLWRRANSNVPAYRQLDALDAVVRELFAPNDRARRNHRMYLATDPFDVARHLLRDLHDRPAARPSGCPPLPLEAACSALAAGGWGDGPFALSEEEQPEQDDDPLERRSALFFPHVFFLTATIPPPAPPCPPNNPEEMPSLPVGSGK